MHIYSNFLPNFTKSEKILLQLVVYNFKNKRALIFSIKEISFLKNKKEPKIYLDKFIKKSISYILGEESGTMQLFSHYTINNSYVEFFLTNIFTETLMEKNNYKSLYIKDIIFFKENFTKFFFYMFIIEKENSRSFYISLEDFRNALELKEYERFYDFERNVLKKLKDDISKNTEFLLTYEKIKLNDFKNSKIKGLQFHIKNKYEEEKVEIINKLMKLASSKINNYKQVYDILYHNLNIYHRTELEILIHKSLRECKKNKSEFKVELEKNLIKKNRFELINEFNLNFKTPIELINILSNELKKAHIYNFLENESITTNLIKKLYFAKEGEELTHQSDNVSLIIKFSRKNPSNVKIFRSIRKNKI